MNRVLRKILRIPYRIRYELRRLRCRILALQFAKVGKGFILGRDSIVVGAQYISVGDHFTAADRTRIEAWDSYRQERYSPQIIFGNNVTMNYDCHIGATHLVKLGDNVMLASRVYITDHFHGNTDPADMMLHPAERPLRSKGPVVIEDDVWIGEGAVILPNVRIGRGAVIGANAVVTKHVPEFAVCAGVPARVIRIAAPGQQKA